MDVIGPDEGGLHVGLRQRRAIQLPHPQCLPGLERLALLQAEQGGLEDVGHPHPSSPGLILAPTVLVQIIGCRSKHIREIAPQILPAIPVLIDRVFEK